MAARRVKVTVKSTFSKLVQVFGFVWITSKKNISFVQFGLISIKIGSKWVVATKL